MSATVARPGDLTEEPTATVVPDADPRTVRLRLSAGDGLPAHSHPDLTIGFHLLEGAIELGVGDDTYALSAGDVAHFDGDQAIEPRAREDSTAFIVLAQTPDAWPNGRQRRSRATSGNPNVRDSPGGVYPPRPNVRVMTSPPDGGSQGHDHDSATSITDEMHDNSWSANLEKPRYADNPDLAVRDALAAVEHTVTGHHVNLVTHADLGHPETFLDDALEAAEDVAGFEYVEQCGCGGHVTRVHVKKPK